MATIPETSKHHNSGTSPTQSARTCGRNGLPLVLTDWSQAGYVQKMPVIGSIPDAARFLYKASLAMAEITSAMQEASRNP